MKTIYYNILLAFILPLFCLANNDNLSGRYKKEKSLIKEFSVNSDALLKISNDYGNLDITSWNENKIIMEITIKVSGDDEEKVMEKLKSIDVEFDSSTQMVSAKTIFDKEKKTWWDKITSGWGNNLNMKINYKVKIPVTNKVDLNNDYGTITLDRIEGDAKINCDYGQIILGELLGNNNYINIDYTNSSTIKRIKKGTINADYSDYEIGSADYIDLVADYTQSKFENVKELKYNCDYGGMKIGNAGSIDGDGDYMDLKINSITKKLHINSDYGSIRVNALKSTVNNVNIKTDYSGVELNVEPELYFDFTIKTSYGGINLDSDFQIMKQSKNNNSKDYQGYHGQKNSGNAINVTSSYGGVKIRKN